MGQLKVVGSVVIALVLQVCAVASPDVPVVAVPDKALLPEVAKIVLNTQPPDFSVLKRDVYVGWLAFNAPEGMDYMDIGAKVVSNNFSNIQKAVAELNYDVTNVADSANKHYGDLPPLMLDMKDNGEPYKFPCADLQAYQCATQILAQKEIIANLVNRNPVLMQRYMQVMQLPHFNSYVYSASDPLPSYQNWVVLSNLRLAQAVVALEAGNAELGFAILQEEMELTKRLLGSNGAILDGMIAQRKLYVIYHVISSMLDTPWFSAYVQDERLAALLAPLNEEEQKSLMHAFENERNGALMELYTANEKDESRKVLFDSGYNRYVASNVYYLMYQPALKRASLSMAEVSDLYMNNTHGDLAQEALKIGEEQVRALSEKNKADLEFYAKWMSVIPVPDLTLYFNQLYDLQSYMALVNTKWEMLKAGVKGDAVHAFLSSHAQLARNPYTQEPFQWDAKAQVLSVPWIDPKSSVAKGHEKMTVFIPFKN